jgi:hypothetical protein
VSPEERNSPVSDELVDLIVAFREELESEIPVKLHPGPSRTGKRTVGMPAGDMGGRRSSALAVTAGGSMDYGWTGCPFRPSFQRYLGHSDEYGLEFIAAASFDEIAAWCRINHDESHWDRTNPAVSLCRRLAVAVVELRQPVSFIASQESQTISNVHHFLKEALAHAAEWRGNRRRTAAERDEDAQRQIDDPINETLRRQHNESHEQRVWERMRKRHLKPDGESLLPTWEFERERRTEQHRKLGCPECMTRAA